MRELGFPNLEVQGWNGSPRPRNARAGDREAAAADRMVAKHPGRAEAHDRRGRRAVGSTQAEMREMLCDHAGKVRPIVVEELKLVVQ